MYHHICSEDNTICIWRSKDWECVHILGGHKAYVNDISIHPTGKMAFSVSKDNVLKLWNLVEGRCAFTRNLKSSSQFSQVSWNDAGDSYLLTGGSTCTVYSAINNNILGAIDTESRINKSIFIPSGSSLSNLNARDKEFLDKGSESYLLIICEDKSVCMYLNAGTLISKIQLPDEVNISIHIY